MYICVLKLRRRSGRIHTNWEFTAGSREQSGEGTWDFSFDGDVLIIRRRIFTYYLVNKN